MNKFYITIFATFIFGFSSCQNTSQNPANTNTTSKTMKPTVVKSDEEWKKQLTPEQYHVLREKGTEPAHTGKYDKYFEKGSYNCAACGYELFKSDNKFDAHCGWPSFDGEIGGGDRVIKKVDNAFGMSRTEILCSNCGGHLGHIFDDGPTKTGMRYCVNSLSIEFKPAESTK